MEGGGKKRVEVRREGGIWRVYKWRWEEKSRGKEGGEGYVLFMNGGGKKRGEEKRERG